MQSHLPLAGGLEAAGDRLAQTASPQHSNPPQGELQPAKLLRVTISFCIHAVMHTDAAASEGPDVKRHIPDGLQVINVPCV